jgi:hypothetical protein
MERYIGMTMKGIYQICLGIIFLVLILAFVSVLSSPIVFASLVQEKSVSKEANPREIIIDRNYNKNNNYLDINEYFELERKFSRESSETLQIRSGWIEMGSLEDPYNFFLSPLSANSHNQRAN